MPRNLAPFTILVLHFAPFFRLHDCRFASRENQMSYTKPFAELITHRVYSSLWFLRFLVRLFGRSSSSFLSGASFYVFPLSSSPCLVYGGVISTPFLLAT